MGVALCGSGSVYGGGALWVWLCVAVRVCGCGFVRAPACVGERALGMCLLVVTAWGCDCLGTKSTGT